MSLKERLLRSHAGKATIAALAVLALLIVGASTLSIVNWDQAAYQYGAPAAVKLDQTHFPHARPDLPTETYQFVGLGPTGTEVVTFRVDWVNHTMTTVNATRGNATMSAVLPAGAFNSMLDRWQAFQNGENPTTGNGLVKNFQLWWALTWSTSVHIDGRNAAQTWGWQHVSLTHWVTTNVGAFTSTANQTGP